MSTPTPREERCMSRRLPQWELTLVVFTLVAAAWSATLSPYYLSLDQILNSTRQFVYPGILAVGLAVVVVLGEIDISLASTLAFGAVLFSKFSAAATPIWLAVPIVVVACAALGALNGVLVARLGLPSLAVTLGTMGAFRGLAFILGSETGYTSFDDSYLYVGSEEFFGSLPISFVLFCGVALAVGVLMRRTVFGRRCYAVGLNKEASLGRGHRRRATQDPGIRARRRAGRPRRAGVDRPIRLGARRQRRRRDPARRHRRRPRRRRHQRRTRRHPRRRARAVPARHHAQRHGPRQRRRPDPDDRTRRPADRRRSPPGDLPRRCSSLSAHVPATGRRAELEEEAAKNPRGPSNSSMKCGSHTPRRKNMQRRSAFSPERRQFLHLLSPSR